MCSNIVTCLSRVETRSLVSLATRGDPTMLRLQGLASEDTGEYVCQVRMICDICHDL